MTSYQVGPDAVWPRAESMVFAWLHANLPGVNVVTETDATFGTAKPSTLMVLPLVLVEVVPGGYQDRDNIANVSMVDVSCFGRDRATAWDLFGRVNEWMLKAIAQTTTKGTFDDVTVENGAGVVPYNNPSLRRVIATYGVATRAQATA